MLLTSEKTWKYRKNSKVLSSVKTMLPGKTEVIVVWDRECSVNKCVKESAKEWTAARQIRGHRKKLQNEASFCLRPSPHRVLSSSIAVCSHFRSFTSSFFLSAIQ